MPLGIGGLTALQTLPRVIIGGAGGCRISDLKGLVHLRGQLSIEGLHKVKEASLHKSKGICDLQLQWSNIFDDSRNGMNEYKLLEGLRPFEKLGTLEIRFYNGTKLPSWVGDPTFDCLTELTLHRCRSCTCLPALGQLPSLQKLVVRCMYELRRLGSEFLGPSNSCHHSVAFPSLEVLEFWDMRGWEEWSTSAGHKVEAFPYVRQILMFNCPKLNSVAIERMPSLQVLKVTGCSFAVFKSMVCVSSSIANLTMSNIVGLTKLDGEVLEHLEAVEDLSILDCNEITYLWESEAAVSLVSIGEKDVNMSISMKSLTRVEIENCQSLESYNCRNSIESLSIKGCPCVTSLTFPTTENLPSALKKLTILECDNMEVSWPLNNFLSSLEDLDIRGIPSFRKDA